jgi:hypothetical protein
LFKNPLEEADNNGLKALKKDFTELVSDVAGMRMHLQGLASTSAWIRLVTDGKACDRRAQELTALTVQTIEAKAAAEHAEASLAGAKAAQEAEFAKREEELRALSERLRQREYALVTSRETVFGALHEMQHLDEQMRRAVMNYGGILAGFNSAIQTLPNWESLSRELLGKSDAHHNEGVAEGVFTPQLPDTEDELAPNQVAGGSMTRSVPRSLRRIQPDA